MPADGAGRLLRAVARHRRSRAAPANTPGRHYDRSALSRCSKRRGGTPTGERAAIGARRAEARIVDYASAGVPPSFFFLGFAGLDRDERPDSTAGFALRSLESRHFVPLSCRLPHASDAGRIARTMALGFASLFGES